MITSTFTCVRVHAQGHRSFVWRIEKKEIIRIWKLKIDRFYGKIYKMEKNDKRNSYQTGVRIVNVKSQIKLKIHTQKHTYQRTIIYIIYDKI